MSNRAPWDGESLVQEWSMGSSRLVMTTARVWLESSQSGRYDLQSLAVDAIQRVALRRIHHPWLLGVAVLVGLLGGLATMTSYTPEAYLVLTCVAVVVLIVAYFVTRSVKLVVASPSGAIEIEVSGGEERRVQALDLLARIEQHAGILRAGRKSP